MTLFYTIALIAFALLTAEYFYLRYCIIKIPLRILINGTRGKSSITKYVAAALRASDKKTVAKITGVIPTIIYPDGSNKVIKRFVPGRVQEQFKLMRLASKLSADCLVLECMSITPELQKLESKIFKPHIYVITNIKDDHREQMGNEKEQVKAICNAIPSNSIVVTDEKKYLLEIEKSVKSQKSSLINANEVSLEDMNTPEDSFESNIKIALAVCKEAEIDKTTALKGIFEEIKSHNQLLYEFQLNGSRIRFVDGFAVNDVSSSQEFINHWQNKLNGFENLGIIFNSRSDRPLRSVEFAKWFGTIKNLNRVILTGSHIPRVRLELIYNGIESQKIITWTRRKVKSTFKYLKEISEPDSVFIGLGNIADQGLLIINSLMETQKQSDNDN